MKLTYITPSGEKKIQDLSESAYTRPMSDVYSALNSDKAETAVSVLRAFLGVQPAILFDSSSAELLRKVKELKKADSGSLLKECFSSADASLLYFTSGSTGSPTGAFKSKDNIESEIYIIKSLISSFRISQAVVTVPFFHLYGSLIGLFLPQILGAEILTSDLFYPRQLLDSAEPGVMVVTTPVYIKALLASEEQKDLSGCLFISSTSPLDVLTAGQFVDRFNANLMQIYGSTETGGIAFRMQKEELWTPFDKVSLSEDEENLLTVESPFVSRYIWDSGLKFTNGKMKTFDFIEKQDSRFRLAGRSSQIFKSAGKRYSTVEMESILEAEDGIRRALVKVSQSVGGLKGEKLEIFLETDRLISEKYVQAILSRKLGGIKFTMTLNRVDKIPTTGAGKKILI